MVIRVFDELCFMLIYVELNIHACFEIKLLPTSVKEAERPNRPSPSSNAEKLHIKTAQQSNNRREKRH